MKKNIFILLVFTTSTLASWNSVIETDSTIHVLPSHGDSIVYLNIDNTEPYIYVCSKHINTNNTTSMFTITKIGYSGTVEEYSTPCNRKELPPVMAYCSNNNCLYLISIKGTENLGSGAHFGNCIYLRKYYIDTNSWDSNIINIRLPNININKEVVGIPSVQIYNNKLYVTYVYRTYEIYNSEPYAVGEIYTDIYNIATDTYETLEPIKISFAKEDGGIADYPSTCIDKNGQLHIAWQQSYANSYNANNTVIKVYKDIYYKTLTSMLPINITSFNDANNGKPRICNDNDNVHFIWNYQNTNGGKCDVMYMQGLAGMPTNITNNNNIDHFNNDISVKNSKVYISTMQDDQTGTNPEDIIILDKYGNVLHHYDINYNYFRPTIISYTFQASFQAYAVAVWNDHSQGKLCVGWETIE